MFWYCFVQSGLWGLLLHQPWPWFGGGVSHPIAGRFNCLQQNISFAIMVRGQVTTLHCPVTMKAQSRYSVGSLLDVTADKLVCAQLSVSNSLVKDDHHGNAPSRLSHNAMLLLLACLLASCACLQVAHLRADRPPQYLCFHVGLGLAFQHTVGPSHTQNRRQHPAALRLGH